MYLFVGSALWNLTDESSDTCVVFLEHGGAQLFLDVLRTFRNDAAVKTKVLGLLNNIAEVKKLRYNLMLDTLVEELYVLLKSTHMDVSYFAAGKPLTLNSILSIYPLTTHPSEMPYWLERGPKGWCINKKRSSSG